MAREASAETPAARSSLDAHLAWWGLRRFDYDADYFQWQSQSLSPPDLAELHRLIEDKRKAATADTDRAFYDAAARPAIVPALYSQRYDYYVQLTPRVMEHLRNAQQVLDFGCGIGILTTWYARQFPQCRFIGIDRSAASIALARARAAELGLANIRFVRLDPDGEALPGPCDVVVATHALVQAEQDPGLPSANWRTFERARDRSGQHAFEQRTGIGPRLDRLVEVLASEGRMIVFEKTRRLARRVPFQRALAARGLVLAAPPELVRYHLVEEIADDGPLYLLQQGGESGLAWDEAPEPDEGRPLDVATLPRSGDGDQPLYENHLASAQAAWSYLGDRRILKEVTREEADGRQFHTELGRAGGLVYLYCANTYDQRQLVIIEPARAAILEAYYREIERG